MVFNSDRNVRSRSAGSTGSTYDPLKKYRNVSLTQAKPLTDKNRAAINPEVVPVLERIARGNGVGAQQLGVLNRAASVSSMASDQSAVSTWHITRDGGYRNKLTVSHKREVVSKRGFKGNLPASRENWYERLKSDPNTGPSGTKYDTDNSKIMFREGHYMQKEQHGDMPTYRQGSERDLRQAVKGLTFFDYFDDNPDQSSDFAKNPLTFTRYHSSKRSQNKALKDNGETKIVPTLDRPTQNLGELGGLQMLMATITKSFGLDENGRALSDVPAIRRQYRDYQAMIKAAASSDEECRKALNYLMPRCKYLSAKAKRLQDGRSAKRAGPA